MGDTFWPTSALDALRAGLHEGNDVRLTGTAATASQPATLTLETRPKDLTLAQIELEKNRLRAQRIAEDQRKREEMREAAALNSAKRDRDVAQHMVTNQAAVALQHAKLQSELRSQQISADRDLQVLKSQCQQEMAEKQRMRELEHQKQFYEMERRRAEEQAAYEREVQQRRAQDDLDLAKVHSSQLDSLAQFHRENLARQQESAMRFEEQQRQFDLNAQRQEEEHRRRLLEIQNASRRQESQRSPFEQQPWEQGKQHAGLSSQTYSWQKPPTTTQAAYQSDHSGKAVWIERFRKIHHRKPKNDYELDEFRSTYLCTYGDLD